LTDFYAKKLKFIYNDDLRDIKDTHKMSSFTKAKRLQKELRDLKNNPPVGVSVGLKNDDLNTWEAIIVGPTNTPYADELLNLEITFPNDYPFKPPKIKFITKMWHPNINPSAGNICLDILQSNWSPALTIDKVLLSISSLLAAPNPDDPLNTEAANQFKKDIVTYNTKAKNCLGKSKNT